ncbi:uncharacterized protein ELE39_001743 [Cryptosporidium sp. chipmunk genotype I]|uniref:uncharacterized protein n=1 Tax=Cryptosporidium sp. chipmunk genotype I TaxID=1280935 RepID=UPI00351A5A18|nr:hypothetical protein ELE39_001743 [Cryptosporidium sp. chipmunk genotype I]
MYLDTCTLAREVRFCVDEYIQIVQFWQFNVGNTNNIVNDNFNEYSSENPNILKEYLFSLLDLPDAQNENPFFANDLLSGSLNVNKKKSNILKRTVCITNFENSKNKNLVNDEDTTVPDNKDIYNEDIELLEDDLESDLDFEYMNSGANEDYDELEDNTNDNDVM